MATNKPNVQRIQRIETTFEKNISKHVKIQTKDNKVYEGYIQKVEDGHVYLAVPKTEKAARMVKTNGFEFGRRGFERRSFGFILIPLAIIAALFLL
ncbi:hypothetical protein [Aneurinibacillus tyrosinisolvens]|uniref:hypothetical protein n=1 Tax=Aneurinibacillus tyrosinisolvens TaxID=1443435 RepID=UPI00063F472C|nr:hypothetical protein [Aneurinibacillus tyrosinisolvens]